MPEIKISQLPDATDPTGAELIEVVQGGSNRKMRLDQLMLLVPEAGNNQPPTVSAGVNQSVYEGSNVSLTATGNDADGTITGYQWTQVSGPAVTLTGANTANASFTAPQVNGSATFVFQVTALDNDSAAGVSQVTITVVDGLAAPTNRTPPSIGGQMYEGGTMSAGPGLWNGNPAPVFTYAWFEVIGGVWTPLGHTVNTRLVAVGDLGKQYGVEVTATNNQGALTVRSGVITITTPGDIETTFNQFYAEDFQLDSGTSVTTQSAVTLPAKSANVLEGGYIDPQFGTLIRRLTSVADVDSPDPGDITALRHEYSRRQAFNANNTRLLVNASNGWWHLYDANTLQKLDGGRTQSPGRTGVKFTTPATPEGHGGDCEPIWHPTDPNKLWYTRRLGGLVWYERDISTGVNSVLFDLTDLIQPLYPNATRAWFKGEGRPSNDGDIWAFMIESEINQIQAIAMYKKSTHELLWHFPLTSNRPDHISTSPLGTHAIVSWYGSAAANLQAEHDRPVTGAAGVRAYDSATTYKTLAVLGEHSDCGIDAFGNEVFVMITFHGLADGVQDGSVMVRRIDDPSIAYWLPINAFMGSSGTGFHMSGCAFKKPGWMIVSKYSGVGEGAWDGQVLACELVPENQRIFRLAHHRSTVGTYFAEPHATVNLDFTRVLFATDMEGQTAHYETFAVLLPSNVIPTAGLYAPVLVTAPVLSGTASPGFTLICDGGSFSGVNISYSYQWYKDGVAISGATANSYLAVAGDMGATITCVVTATNGAGSVSSGSAGAVVGPLAAPVNLSAPTVSGGAEVGQPMSVSPGSWSGNPIPTFSYQWEFFTGGSWTDVGGAGTATMTPGADGDYRARVTASNSQGNTQAWTSTVTVGVAPDPKEVIGVSSANSTWSSSAAVTRNGVLAGSSLILAIELDEPAPGDALPNSLPDVLGKSWQLVVAGAQVTGQSGRVARSAIYVAYDVSAGNATVALPIDTDGHWSMHLIEAVGITQADVVGSSGSASVWEATMQFSTVDTTTSGKGLAVSALMASSDMGNGMLTVPDGFTLAGTVDQAGPLMGAAAYKLLDSAQVVSGQWISGQAGGYGNGWSCVVATFK